jgi:hypothetical protein
MQVRYRSDIRVFDVTSFATLLPGICDEQVMGLKAIVLRACSE